MRARAPQCTDKDTEAQLIRSSMTALRVSLYKGRGWTWPGGQREGVAAPAAEDGSVGCHRTVWVRELLWALRVGPSRTKHAGERLVQEPLPQPICLPWLFPSERSKGL